MPTKKNYCIYCYKKAAIRDQDASTLFDDIFQKHKKACLGEPTPVVQDLHEFINNYLWTSNFEMNSKQFYEWREKNKNSSPSTKDGEKSSFRNKLVENNEEKKKGWKENARYQQTRKSYETAIKLATDD